MGFDAYLEQLQGDAEHHGTGAFSVDLQRMQQVLGSHQLAWPEEYVLCVLSSAVLNGATFLRLEQRRGCTRLLWDGPPLQLENLFSELGRSSSSLGELAVAVLSARRLGEVSLVSSSGRLSFRGQDPILENPLGEGPNCLTLRRRWWKWLGRISPAARILRQRARFAPLEVLNGLAPDKVKAQRVFYSAMDLPDWLSTADPIELPAGNWGAGLVLEGASDWRLIRHGVSYAFPAAMPGLVVYWWSDRLPMDLSRKELLRGPEFEAWLVWLHDCLATEAQNRNLSELLPTMVRAGRYSQQGAFLTSPLFRMANGTRSSLAQLRDSYRQHGWLPVVSRPMILEWDPERVAVVQDPHERALMKLFANWLNLDHLENVTDLPRLPVDEDYVVRIPFLKGKGEAGLRRYPGVEGFREWIQGSWHNSRKQPFGVDSARDPHDPGAFPLGELYWTLKLMSLSDTWLYCRTYHLLTMFAWLVASFRNTKAKKMKRQHPLLVLLDPTAPVLVKHVRGNIQTPQLRELANQIQLELNSGQAIALLDIPRRCHKATVWRWRVASDCLALDFSQVVSLPHLFLPDSLHEVVPPDGQVTTALLRLLRGAASPGQLLRRLLAYRRCSGYKLLEAAGLLKEVSQAIESYPLSVDQLLDWAREEMRTSNRPLNSAYVALAFTRLPGLEVARSKILPLLQFYADYELICEFEPICELPGLPSELLVWVKQWLAYAYCYSGRYQEARDLFVRSSHPTALELAMIGSCHCFEGFLGKGLEFHRQAAAKDSEAHYATRVAESLMFLGQRQEARAALPSSDDSYTLMTRAQLADTPQECLELCDRIQAAGPDQYFELAEARGLAYHKLGRYEESSEWLKRFLQARPDNSLLYLRQKRMAQARELLAEMVCTDS